MDLDGDKGPGQQDEDRDKSHEQEWGEELPSPNLGGQEHPCPLLNVPIPAMSLP